MAIPGVRRSNPVRVDGLTEAKAALAFLPEAFRQVAAETIDTGTAIIESEAHGNVPIDEGDLDRSIGRAIRDDGLQATVGAGDIAAKFTELGTEHMAAQPWLYPAYRTGVRFIRRAMKGWSEDAGQKVRVRSKRRKK